MTVGVCWICNETTSDFSHLGLPLCYAHAKPKYTYEQIDELRRLKQPFRYMSDNEINEHLNKKYGLTLPVEKMKQKKMAIWKEDKKKKWFNTEKENLVENNE